LRKRLWAAGSPPVVRVWVKTGTKATVKAPSARRRRRRLGMRKATMKAAAAGLSPKNEAVTWSRARPASRDKKVAPPTMPAVRAIWRLASMLF